MMNTKINQVECISSLIDGDVTDTQLDAVLSGMKTRVDLQAQSQWAMYHQIGDVLRSEELGCSMSVGFNDKFSRLLDQEPVIFAPNIRETNKVQESINSTIIGVALKSYLPRYVAITSIAAAVMVAFIMTPQILPLINQSNSSPVGLLTKHEAVNPKVETNVQLAKNHDDGEKVAEFAPTLMDQVEMLRDPTLDSYLMAHQKASPAFAHSGRYVKKANIDPSKENEK
jgi:sigma-E factor negative regulatory protein RseA